MTWTRIGLLTSALLAIGSAALAQEEPSSLRFVDALARRGWYDLAAIALDDLGRDRATPAVVLEQLPLLRADLLLSAALATEEPAERRRRLEEVTRSFGDLATKAGPGALDARFGVGEVLLRTGDVALERLRARSSADLRVEADGAFTAAAAYFHELADALEAGAACPIERAAQARFLEARARWRQAQVHDGGPERDALLRGAVDGFTRVNLEYGDTLVGYDAALHLGLAEKDRGRPAEALAAFVSAERLAESVGWTKGQAWEPGAQDVVGRALLLEAQLHNEQAASGAALEAARRFHEAFPDLDREDDPLALALRLEEAVARDATGDRDAALAIVAAVESALEGRGGALAERAREVRAAITGGAASSELSTEEALDAARAQLDHGQVHEGLARLRALVATCEAGDAAARAFMPRLLHELGRAYLERERLDEAAACFGHLAAGFAAHDLAAPALFHAASCASRMNGALPNAFDRDRSLDLLRLLVARYPTTTAASSAAFLLGNERLEARDFPGAAAEYEKVGEAAGEFHDAALYQSGIAWLHEGRSRFVEGEHVPARTAFERALAAFERTIAWVGSAGTKDLDPARRRNLRRCAFESWLRTAELRLHPLLSDPARALEAARAAESALGDGGPVERVGEARALVVQSWLAAGDPAAGEAALAELVSVAPAARCTADAERDVALALEAQGRSLEGAAGVASATLASATLARAADHLTAWLERSTRIGLPVPAVTASRTGDRLLRIALTRNGLPEDTFSFSEVADLAALPDASRFRQALRAYELASATTAGEAWVALLKRARCHGLLREYVPCARLIGEAVALERLVDPAGAIALDVARAKPALLFAYADQGRALRETSAGPRDAALAAAREIFRRLVSATPRGSELWWRSKYELLVCLSRAGEYEAAAVGIRSLRRANPDLGGARYGPLLEALAAELETKRPR